jgi:hypothetical protein
MDGRRRQKRSKLMLASPDIGGEGLNDDYDQGEASS